MGEINGDASALQLSDLGGRVNQWLRVCRTQCWEFIWISMFNTYMKIESVIPTEINRIDPVTMIQVILKWFEGKFCVPLIGRIVLMVVMLRNEVPETQFAVLLIVLEIMSYQRRHFEHLNQLRLVNENEQQKPYKETFFDAAKINLFNLSCQTWISLLFL